MTGLPAQNRNVIVTKGTATWCTNCGLWGWDYKEALKDALSTGPMTFISAHFLNSQLENEASLWFARNLNISGQPRFYFNNDLNQVGFGTWNSQLASSTEEIISISEGTVSLSFDGVNIEGNNVSCTVRSEISTTAPDTEYTIAVYVYENNVVYDQAGWGNDAIHTNVLRSSLGAPEGIPFEPQTAHNFEAEVEESWNKEELGLLAVFYRIDGDKYVIEESTAVSNFAAKTSSEDLLDSRIFGYSDTETELIITADDQEYEMTLTDMNGRLVHQNQISKELSIQKDSTPPGIYIATFRTKSGFYSQQLFIK